jgi:hypothetical protein
LKDPFSFTDQNHTQWSTDIYDKINGGDNAARQEAARTRLVNQGIAPGSEAWNREMQNLDTAQSRSRDQFMLDSLGQDFSMQQAQRNQNVNESTALATGGQVSQPIFGQPRVGSVATTDNAGIINQDYQNRLAKSQVMGSNIGGLFSGLGSVFSFSDKRLKTDIKEVGKVKGNKIYEYRYKSGGPMQIGVMAQDIEKKNPNAVKTHASGYKMVNYADAFSLGA